MHTHYIYIYREMGEGWRERERAKNIWMVVFVGMHACNDPKDVVSSSEPLQNTAPVRERL